MTSGLGSPLFPPGSVPVCPSHFCLGTCDFGTAIPCEKAFEILDLFFEKGGNFIDSAHIYASWLPEGEGASEKTVGAWLTTRKVRDAMVIATKGGHPPLSDMSQGRCSRKDLAQDIQDSLERLQVDWIDLYWLHRDDPSHPVEDILAALHEFTQKGWIRSYGASNWTWDRLDKARKASERMGIPGFCASQPGWSLADYPNPAPIGGMVFLQPEDIELHTQSGFPVVPFSSQAKGYFGQANVDWALGGFRGQPPRGSEYDSAENRERLLRCCKLARQKGCTANQVALAFLLAHPFQVYPIIGTGNENHLLMALEADQIPLEIEEREYLRNPTGPLP